MGLHNRCQHGRVRGAKWRKRQSCVWPACWWSRRRTREDMFPNGCQFIRYTDWYSKGMPPKWAQLMFPASLLCNLEGICLFSFRSPSLFCLLVHSRCREVWFLTWSHSSTRHSRYDPSGRVIGPSQRPLPDNTSTLQDRKTMPPILGPPFDPRQGRWDFWRCHLFQPQCDVFWGLFHQLACRFVLPSSWYYVMLQGLS
jgi:hypothetical protein